MQSKHIGMLPLFLATTLPFIQHNAAAAESPVIIEAVECKGNVSIPCEFIQRSLNLRPDSKVDDDAVQSAQLRLSALTNFESVRIYLQKGSERDKAVLIVEVAEASQIIKDFSVGLNYYSFESPNERTIQSDFWTEELAGRIGHLNLFGRQKIGELTVKGYHQDRSYPNADIEYNILNVSLRYIDPHFLNVDRLFMSVSSEYGTAKGTADYVYDAYDPITDSYVATEAYQKSTSDNLTAQLSIGYRLWQYSYVFANFEHIYSTGKQRNVVGDYDETSRGSGHLNTYRLGYGWDSEDDAYFPTRGSRVSAVVFYRENKDADAVTCGCNQIDWTVAYKHTWMMGRNSVWSVNVGGEPMAPSDRLRPATEIGTGLGLTYAHLLPNSDALGGLRRGRWYVQLGTGPLDLSRDGHVGGEPSVANVKLGLRFESKALGIVNLYAAGTRFLLRSGQ